MKSQKEELLLTEAPKQGTKARFQIEKLEERIAPAKGGIPGSSGDGGMGPGNKPGGWGGSCHPKHGCSL